MTGLLTTATVTALYVGIEAVGVDATEMTTAMTRLDHAVTEALAAHGGARSASDASGFVAEFNCAREALACAVDLQRAPVAPIRLRIAVHTEEVRPRRSGDRVGGGAA